MLQIEREPNEAQIDRQPPPPAHISGERILRPDTLIVPGASITRTLFESVREVILVGLEKDAEHQITNIELDGVPVNPFTGLPLSERNAEKILNREDSLGRNTELYIG